MGRVVWESAGRGTAARSASPTVPDLYCPPFRTRRGHSRRRPRRPPPGRPAQGLRPMESAPGTPPSRSGHRKRPPRQHRSHSSARATRWARMAYRVAPDVAAFHLSRSSSNVIARRPPVGTRVGRPGDPPGRGPFGGIRGPGVVRGRPIGPVGRSLGRLRIPGAHAVTAADHFTLPWFPDLARLMVGRELHQGGHASHFPAVRRAGSTRRPNSVELLPHELLLRRVRVQGVHRSGARGRRADRSARYQAARWSADISARGRIGGRQSPAGRVGGRIGFGGRRLRRLQGGRWARAAGRGRAVTTGGSAGRGAAGGGAGLGPRSTRVDPAAARARTQAPATKPRTRARFGAAGRAAAGRRSRTGSSQPPTATTAQTSSFPGPPNVKLTRPRRLQWPQHSRTSGRRRGSGCMFSFARGMPPRESLRGSRGGGLSVG